MSIGGDGSGAEAPCIFSVDRADPDDLLGLGVGQVIAVAAAVVLVGI